MFHFYNDCFKSSFCDAIVEEIDLILKSGEARVTNDKSSIGYIWILEGTFLHTWDDLIQKYVKYNLIKVYE